VKRRVLPTLAAAGLAMTLAGCGLFGVKGPGLDGPAKNVLDPHCLTPPYELPAMCPLGGIGADTTIFNASHAYVGSQVVIPGSTNYLAVKIAQGRVTSFEEHFHADPPLSDREARRIAAAEVPSDSKRLWIKNVGTMCQVLEYQSKRLRQMYGRQFSAVLIVLQSADPNVLDKTNVAMARVSLAAPHSRSSVTTC
jgi:predicted small lipoprotein YifL